MLGRYRTVSLLEFVCWKKAAYWGWWEQLTLNRTVNVLWNQNNVLKEARKLSMQFRSVWREREHFTVPTLGCIINSCDIRGLFVKHIRGRRTKQKIQIFSMILMILLRQDEIQNEYPPCSVLLLRIRWGLITWLSLLMLQNTLLFFTFSSLHLFLICANIRSTDCYIALFTFIYLFIYVYIYVFK